MELNNVAINSKASKVVFQALLGRERFRRITNLRLFRRILAESGSRLMLSDIVEVFNRLEAAGVGRVLDAQGVPKFEWYYDLKQVARAAISGAKLSERARLKPIQARPQPVPVAMAPAPSKARGATFHLVLPAAMEPKDIAALIQLVRSYEN